MQRKRRVPLVRHSGWRSIAAGTRSVALAYAGVVMLAGCAVGPDFERPAAPEVDGYTPERLAAETVSAEIAGGDAQRFANGMDIPAQWWTLFRSEPLNALIERAIAANPDLQAAQAALRVAQENAYAQIGGYYPQISGSFSTERSKTPSALSPPTSNEKTFFTLHTAQVSVSYAPDVFGLNRRAVESLKAQTEAQRFQVEATYLTLTSNVVAAAVQEASLRGQVIATEDVIAIESEVLEILRRQFALGEISEGDVLAQEAALAQAQQALPPLQKQLAQQRNLLAALTGQLPSRELSETFDLAELQLPLELPVSLPSKLVEQRPDVRAAEAQMHAASAEIGVAIANRLPNIVLTAVDGSVATQMGKLLTPGNGFWTLAGSVTQPIFQGGSLMHRERAARAAYDQASAQYRSTVITAFQNVADTLRALQSDADALKAAVTAERAALRSLDIARDRLRLGEIGYLSLLNAQQTYQQARISLVAAQAERYADTAALFQALGGGWWNRSQTVSAE